ncbi:MAG: LysR substrate-binding domain-containing protein [Aurantibacter sp.]
MNITITQLEYIVAVDTHRNFAKAAAHCFITQPTLSMQIKKLEQQLGVLIFDRSKKPVKPTTVGENVIEQARSSLRSLTKIEEIIMDSKGEIKGELRIGVIPTLAPYLLPRFIVSFVEKYPNTKLRLEELLSDQILNRLSMDLLDVGIMIPPTNSSIHSIHLFQEEFLLYSSSNHRLLSRKEIEIKDLNTQDLWLLKDGHCFRDQVESICGQEISHNSTRSIQFESGSLETLKSFINKKQGFTLLPELATLDWRTDEKKRLRRFKGEKPVREVGLVVHRSYLKEGLIKVLKEEIIASLPTEVLGKTSTRVIKWMPES